MLPSLPVSMDFSEKNPQSSDVPAADYSLSFLYIFLSDANDGTIGAILVGLLALAYVLLGNVGLLLGGVIFGIFLHATWVGHSKVSRKKSRNGSDQQEISLDIIRRVLEWQSGGSGLNKSPQDGAKADLAVRIASGKPLDFSEFPSEVSTALDELVDAAIRDYVQFWYAPLLPHDQDFPMTARQTLLRFLSAFMSHQAQKRPSDAFLTFLTNATSIIVIFLNELSRALVFSENAELEISNAITSYLENHPQSSLADIVDPDEQEKRFSQAADDLLQAFLDHKTYNCEAARIFFKNVFSRLILESVLTSVSQPDWINEWIVFLLEEGEPELLNALDAGVGRATESSPLQHSLDSADLLASSDQFKDKNLNKVDLSFKSFQIPGEDLTIQAAEHDTSRFTQTPATTEVQKGEQHSSDQHIISQSTQQAREAIDHSSLPKMGVSSRHENNDRADEASLEEIASVGRSNAQSFTSFDQIVPPYRANPDITVPPPLTLHRAKVTLLDDMSADERVTVKARPQIEYLLQIEPANSAHSGWMVARMFHEFEPLHEYLYRIANVSGAPAFSRRYQNIPSFKGRTRIDVRMDLERYLSDALTHETLAESEGMKKFLDKDQGFTKSTGAKSSLKFPMPVGDAFQSVGKGVLGGFNSASKGVAAGSQAVLEGVGGLFAGQRKMTVSQSRPNAIVSAAVRDTSTDQVTTNHVSDDRHKSEFSRTELSADESVEPKTQKSQSGGFDVSKTLDESSDHSETKDGPSGTLSNAMAEGTTKQDGYVGMVQEPEIDPGQMPTQISSSQHGSADPQIPEGSMRASLNEEETRVAVELMFAAINELFSLSGVWNIRRTLLNAAKSYILRPGNPALSSIRDLLQSSLNSALSPQAVGSNIRKIRENGLPTAKEFEAWPSAKSSEEKWKLRMKARQLFISKGMPQALTSIMGAAASRVALGRVFDALQTDKIRRGILSALLLQGLKTTIF